MTSLRRVKIRKISPEKTRREERVGKNLASGEAHKSESERDVRQTACERKANK